MQHWNYRIIKYKKGGYGIHEVYYEDGKPIMHTEEPVRFACDDNEGPDDLISSLKMALKDAQNAPVLDELDEGSDDSKGDIGSE